MELRAVRRSWDRGRTYRTAQFTPVAVRAKSPRNSGRAYWG
jgi:hypothetical protein